MHLKPQLTTNRPCCSNIATWLLLLSLPLLLPLLLSLLLHQRLLPADLCCPLRTQ